MPDAVNATCIQTDTQEEFYFFYLMSNASGTNYFTNC